MYLRSFISIYFVLPFTVLGQVQIDTNECGCWPSDPFYIGISQEFLGHDDTVLYGLYNEIFEKRFLRPDGKIDSLHRYYPNGELSNRIYFLNWIEYYNSLKGITYPISSTVHRTYYKHGRIRSIEVSLFTPEDYYYLIIYDSLGSPVYKAEIIGEDTLQGTFLSESEHKDNSGETILTYVVYDSGKLQSRWYIREKYSTHELTLERVEVQRRSFVSFTQKKLKKLILNYRFIYSGCHLFVYNINC